MLNMSLQCPQRAVEPFHNPDQARHVRKRVTTRKGLGTLQLMTFYLSEMNILGTFTTLAIVNVHAPLINSNDMSKFSFSSKAEDLNIERLTIAYNLDIGQRPYCTLR